jgi:hypothetical protein
MILLELLLMSCKVVNLWIIIIIFFVRNIMTTTKEFFDKLYSKNNNTKVTAFRLSSDSGAMKVVRRKIKSLNITGLKRVEPTMGSRRSPRLYFVFDRYELRLDETQGTTMLKLTLISYNMNNHEENLKEAKVVESKILPFIRLLCIAHVSERESYFGMEYNKQTLIFDKDISL